MPWLGLASLLGWNLSRHRRGLSTLCSIGRLILPPAAFLAGWAAFNAWFIPHVLRGYPPRARRPYP